MPVSAASFMTHTANSRETGRSLAKQLQEAFREPPSLVVTYLTVNHDQRGFLEGLGDVLGSEVPVVGCSTQGVVGRGWIREEGYAAGVMAIGGAGVSFANGIVDDIQDDTLEKGRALGRQLCEALPAAPSAVVLHYDALCGVNPDRFLEGMFREVRCPILGGAAAHSYSYQALRETYVYRGCKVATRAAVAFGMCGDFSFEIAHSHGCSPSGVELTVTRARENLLFELDGARAADVWEEICGDVTSLQSQVTALAIGVPQGGSDQYLVRSAYSIDPESGAIALGPAIPEGTKIMLHHRSVEEVLEGSRRMSASLAERLGSRRARAVFGFECGARTRPFLGDEATLEENLDVQGSVAGDPAWIGMFPWGELVPVAGRPAFHNYAYSLLVLAD